jgi:hypothetical protein
MRTLKGTGIIVAVTMIALAGIALVVASSLLLVQSAKATTDVVTSTTVGGGGEEEAASTTTTTNNNSDAILGSLFLTAESGLTSFNQINETYIEISFMDNSTIMPPNATTTINATETGNVTLTIQPNGLTFAQGQGFLVTQDDEAVQEENATATFVELSRVGPDGTGSGTGVVFYNTNSTELLAFLDNMVGIFQHEFSPERDTLRIWEWKGGTIPFENAGSGAVTTGNQTTIS